jgi:hypothetical protein
LDRKKIITTAIAIGIFGGLVGGPILSLADYYAHPEGGFWIFIIPEFIGFSCLNSDSLGQIKRRKENEKLSTSRE